MTSPSYRTITVDGRKLAFRDAGSGTPLVLVHGIGSGSRMWDGVFDSLSTDYRVIAWDAPGYGDSDPLPMESPLITDYSWVLSDLLSQLEISAAHLLGHSIGAAIVASLCRRRNVSPLTVTLLHPVSGAGRQSPSRRNAIRQSRIDELKRSGMRQFVEQRGSAILGSGISEEQRRLAVSNMAEVPPGAYLQLWEALCAADMLSDLPWIEAPAMVVCGEEDPVAPQESCREVASRIRAPVSFECLSGIGHSLPVEDPKRFERALRQFLRGAE